MQPFPTTSREILALIGDRATFNRGKRYANQGRVQLTSPPEGDHTTNGRLRWECSVLGSKEYRVILEDHQGNLERLSCSCPAFGRMGVCKHIAAALLYLLEHGFLEPDVDPTGQRRIGHRSSAVLENTPAPEDEAGMAVGPKPRDDHTTSASKPRATRANQTREEEFQKNRTAVTGLIQRLEDLLELEHQPSGTSTGPVPAPGRQVTSHLSIEYILVHEGHVNLELKAGVDRTFVVKNIRDFIRDVQIGTSHPLTPRFSYQPELHDIGSEDLAAMRVLSQVMAEESFYRSVNGYYSYERKLGDRRIALPPAAANALLDELRGRQIFMTLDNAAPARIFVAKDPLPSAGLEFRLLPGDKTTEEGIRLDLAPLARAEYLAAYRWLVVDGTLYRLSEQEDNLVSSFMQALRSETRPGGFFRSYERPQPYLSIPRDLVGTALSLTVPALETIGKIRVQPSLSKRIAKFPLRTEVLVDEGPDALSLDVSFHYENAVFRPVTGSTPKPSNEEADRSVSPSMDKIYIRDMDREMQVISILNESPVTVKPGPGGQAKLSVPKEDETLYRFFHETVPALTALDHVSLYLSDGASAYVTDVQPQPEIRFDLDPSGGWLTVRFDVHGVDPAEVEQIRQALLRGMRYVHLESGAFLSLEDESFRRARSVLQTVLGEARSSSRKGRDTQEFRVPLYKTALLVDADDTRGVARYSAAVRTLVESISDPEALEIAPPAGLRTALRPYQLTGFRWMKTLAQYSLGGILADEMGLGKTVQTIAFLLSERETAPTDRPSLLVVPASLMYNWEAEFRRFAPSLRVTVVDGPPESRNQKLQNMHDWDIVVTSYPLLRQDIAQYADIPFEHLILDEAQTVKNHTTQIFRAVQQIQAPKRFALTGTPIENALDDLWSIIHTLMPGLFPPLQRFKDLTPEQARRRVRPFILRRTKEDVLRDLPERTEMIYWVELDDKQKAAYLAFLNDTQLQAQQLMQDGGLTENRIAILALITRLRQVCADPALVVPEYAGNSAKLEALLELLRDYRAAGRRALVFSQFTQMLKRIRACLFEEGIEAFYLDGRTPPKDRLAMADAFNAGERGVFLISLRAGGTGLNLTGADTVILYDLWWNPAVDAQAIGRAHRIGQKNPVLVLRLIAKGTIEEQMYALQMKKQALFDRVIESEQDPSAFRLTEEDVRALLSLTEADAEAVR
ncbi:MAG: Superfamily II DNA/RNA helicase [Candidatus Carbobacillus altaicus]|uniref:Superfamily II DNA/RNA helicase n=1 Tax=Candidatus Carbonibacillus altaicus TaxID=2163959 RepID=A0A2R6Y562_9BACL|nr:MAG: Superfamily II DNA/RNA helicase [Candidatus Carbobacillus altaicus]